MLVSVHVGMATQVAVVQLCVRAPDRHAPARATPVNTSCATQTDGSVHVVLSHCTDADVSLREGDEVGVTVAVTEGVHVPLAVIEDECVTLDVIEDECVFVAVNVGVCVLLAVTDTVPVCVVDVVLVGEGVFV
jgi:hypothetical protein